VPLVDRLTDVPGVAPSTRYAQAVTVTGRLAFVAGQVAMAEDGSLVGEGDVRAQTVQALRNLGAVLAGLGATWSDVVRFGWYLTDVSRVQELRDARDEVVGDAPAPASTLVEVAGLFRQGFLVEVDAVVALPD
jgi:enamine deaminase RidA (YjgF/YER057c/UK114 family)